MERPLTPAEQLARLLDERQMSRRQLSKQLAEMRGIAESTARSSIYKWMRGSHVPDDENAMALARIFSVSAILFRTSPAGDEDGEYLILEALEEIRLGIVETLEALTVEMRAVLTEMALQIRRQSDLLEAIAGRVVDFPEATTQTDQEQPSSQ